MANEFKFSVLVPGAEILGKEEKAYSDKNGVKQILRLVHVINGDNHVFDVVDKDVDRFGSYARRQIGDLKLLISVTAKRTYIDVVDFKLTQEA